MDKKGIVEIRINGKKGELPLTPENYDISEIRVILENAENLLFPNDHKGRPVISYEIREGSVRHILKTSIQAIIGFNALLAQIQSEKNIDFLEYPTAKAISYLQDISRKYQYTFEISTSMEQSSRLTIDPFTHYELPENEWVDAEFYFYGEVTDMGGKGQPNIHVAMPGVGNFTIDTPREVLASYEKNPLYKPLGVRATGRQNLHSGEIDKSSLRFKEFIDYQLTYDEGYLKKLIDKASNTWRDIADPDEWVRELRGAPY